jgi:hypothetical protein
MFVVTTSCFYKKDILGIVKKDGFKKFIESTMNKKIVGTEKDHYKEETIYYNFPSRSCMAISNGKDDISFQFPDVYEYKDKKIFQEIRDIKSDSLFLLNTAMISDKYSVQLRLMIPNGKEYIPEELKKQLFIMKHPKEEALEYIKKIIDYIDKEAGY